jgi:PhzF family phenazine biosynthesis protein
LVLSTELQSDMKVEFATIDVFTDRQFGGNPLAVVADGTELSTPQMQAIAAEFNLAETTFVLPPERPENTAKVRIFTPRAELPFAGHPISAPPLCWGNAASAMVGRSRATLCNLKKSLA